MAVDILVAFPQVSIPLTSVQVIPNTNPRMLDIHGEDFRAVDSVLVNEIEAKNVVILGPKRLLAEVPAGIIALGLAEVQVISRSFTINKQSLIKFRLGTVPAKTSGLMRLMQLFLKVLLTSSGSDIFTPRLGGSALKNLGQNTSREGGGVVSDFIVAVDLTARQLIALQGRDPSLPPDEKLLKAKVVSATFDRGAGALIVAVELTSQTGQAALANLAT